MNAPQGAAGEAPGVQPEGLSPGKAPKIPVSVLVVIHTLQGEVLLIERADHAGFWQSVTGSIDWPDEPPADAARRELAEETGITGGVLLDWAFTNVYEIYPRWRHRYAPGVTQNTEHVFGVTVPTGTPVTLSPREHRAFCWLPWRDAAARCFSPSNAEAILQLPRFLPHLLPPTAPNHGP